MSHGEPPPSQQEEQFSQPPPQSMEFLTIASRSSLVVSFMRIELYFTIVTRYMPLNLPGTEILLLQYQKYYNMIGKWFADGKAFFVIEPIDIVGK